MLKANLIGNIGGAPEMRYAASGTAVLRFNVACNGRVRGPDGEWQDRTEWVRVTVFGQRAESLEKHLTKGSRVYVDGRLEARTWTTKDGEIRAGLEVVANDVEFAGPRPAANGEQQDGQGRAPAQQRTQTARPGYEAADLEELPF